MDKVLPENLFKGKNFKRYENFRQKLAKNEANHFDPGRAD
jgi:hypothetical protein